jgi:endothelin-converting enzyme
MSTHTRDQKLTTTQADDKNPDQQIIQVGAPGSIGLPSKEYYKDADIVNQYTNMIAAMLNIVCDCPSNAGVLFTTESQPGHELHSRSEADTGALAKAIVDFESQLSEASPNPDDADDVTVSLIGNLR